MSSMKFRLRKFLCALLFSLSMMGTPVLAKAHTRKKRPLPNSWDLIAQSLSGSSVPYQGKMELTDFLNSSSSVSMTAIRFSPPHFYRREIFDGGGKVKEIAVSNGKEEWVYRRDTKEYWKMPAPAPLDAKKELTTLKSNYEASPPVRDRAADRRALKIKLFSRKDHAMARIFWLDPKYGVVLKTEIYDDKGRLKYKSGFKKIRFFVRKPVPAKWFALNIPKKARSAQETLGIEGQSAQKKFGFPPLNPSWLPFGYALQEIRTLDHQGRAVIQEEFSDGINALSLFEYKDTGSPFDGEKIPFLKGTAYLQHASEGKVLSWKEGPLRLVLISSLDTEKILRIAGSIP